MNEERMLRIEEIPGLDGETVYAAVMERYPSYAVTKDARVFRVRARRGDDLPVAEWMLVKPVILPGATMRSVQIIDGAGKRTYRAVAALVAEVWVVQPKGFNRLRFCNGNSLDDRADNLQWMPGGGSLGGRVRVSYRKEVLSG